MKSVQSVTFRVSNDVWNLSVSNCMRGFRLVSIMAFVSVLFQLIYLFLVPGLRICKSTVVVLTSECM
jgi:hypothetical protein